MARIGTSMESSSRLRKVIFFYLATALLAMMLSLALTISLTLFGHQENELYGPLYWQMTKIGVRFLLVYLLIVIGLGFVMKPLVGRILLHADRKLRDLTKKLETAQQLAKSGWWEYDVRNDAVIWPDETYALFGLAPETTIDYNRLVQCIHPDYRDSFNKTNHLICENGAAEYQYPIVHPDGKQCWMWAKCEAVYDENGKPVRLFGTVQDITDRKRSEQALADSESRLADILDFLPDPTFVIDIDGCVISWNRAIERMTGVDKKAMIGKSGYAYAVPFYGEPRPMLIDLAVERNQQWERTYLSLKEEDGLIVETESFNPSMAGGERYLAATAGRLYDTQGNFVGAIETIRDITVTKRTEQEREKLINELKEAIAQVRTLSGLLPMCSKCKKIRDDSGYWNQLETYISQHTDVDISHGLCPECMDEMYGGEDWYDQGYY